MSQVDLTHSDDYVVALVNIINITTIVFTSLQCSNDSDVENDKRCPWEVLMVAYSYLMNS